MVKKLKFYKNFKISRTHKKSIILIGNFDGLHLGHQKLFNLAKKYKTIPVYKRVMADLLTPISVYMKLKQTSNYSFIFSRQ